MSLRIATKDEIKNWDEHVLKNPDGGNALQGHDFAIIKHKQGAKVRYFIDEDLHVAAMAIEKSVPLVGKIWYFPKGPGVVNAGQLHDFAGRVRELAAKHGVISVKVEPDLEKGTKGIDENILVPVKGVQPNQATVWIHTGGDIKDVLSALPQRGRRAIRQAEKAGVTVSDVEITPESCKEMYQLYKETALDAGFADRGEKYYLDFYLQYAKTNQGKLFFAYHDGKLLAGAFVMLFGKKAIYKDGGSKRSKSASGVGHLLHWRIIEWLNEHGYEDYDFFGAPPANKADDKSHPYYGIGIFKTSFNKQITEYVGAYNLAVGSKGEMWQKWLEKAVRKVYFLVKHQSFY